MLRQKPSTSRTPFAYWTFVIGVIASIYLFVKFKFRLFICIFNLYFVIKRAIFFKCYSNLVSFFMVFLTVYAILNKLLNQDEFDNIFRVTYNSYKHRFQCLNLEILVWNTP